MKLRGSQPLPYIVQEVHLRRPNNIALIFKFKTVTDLSEFDKVCPEPNPRFVQHPDGSTEPYFDDTDYQEKHKKWQMQRVHWMFLHSISATDDLEWETVNMGDPATWENYAIELDAWMIPSEKISLLNACSQANILTNDMLKAAREDFLAGKIKELPLTAICQKVESPSTPSGEPVVVSE